MVNLAGLLSSDRITRDQLFSFFDDLSTPLKPIAKSPNPVGVLSFFEPSTRTKLSFEKAGLDLGIRWMQLEPKGSSLEKGESLEETFKTIALYRPQFFVVRHAVAGFAHLVHDWTGLPVINAGDGQRDHPTQGLLDAYTLWSKNKTKKYTVAFFGDVARSRVARADIHLFKLLGYSISVVDDGQPETSLFAKAFKVKLIDRKKIKQSDVAVCLRVQKERGSARVLAPLSSADLHDSQWLMHPGPVMIGEDMTHELCDFSRPQCLIREQVANGLKIRTALLRSLVSGGSAS